MFLYGGLGWARGFPSPGERADRLMWLSVPAPGTDAESRLVVVDASLIREATSAVAALDGFPRALPRIVGDSKAWRARTTTLLEVLKGCVHRGAEIPKGPPLLGLAGFSRGCADCASRLSSRSKQMSRLVEALAWVHFGNESAFGEAIRAAASRRSQLEVVIARQPSESGLRLAVHLCDLLLEDGETRVGHLLKLLGDERSYTTPFEPGPYSRDILQQAYDCSADIARLRGWRQDLGRTEIWLPGVLCQFVERMVRLDRASRRKALTLATVALPVNLLDRWERWWRRAESIRGKIENGFTDLIGKEAAGRGAHSDLLAVKAATTTTQGARAWLRQRTAEAEFAPLVQARLDLEALERSRPPRCPRSFVRTAESAARGLSDPQYRALAKALAALPDSDSGVRLRMALLVRWAEDGGTKSRTRTELLSRFAGHLATVSAPLRATAPWRQGLAEISEDLESFEDYQAMQYGWQEPSLLPDDWFLSGGLPSSRIPTLFRTLGALEEMEWEGRRGRAFWFHFPTTLLFRLLRLSPDPVFVAEALHALWRGAALKAARQLATPCFDAAAHLADSDHELFAQLVRRLRRFDPAGDKGEDARPGWGEGLASLAADEMVRPILVSAMLGSEGKRVIQLAYQAYLLRRLRPPLDPAHLARSALDEPAARATGGRGWLDRYPAELHESLFALAEVDPEARKAASRILSATFPDPDALTRELAAIRRKLETARGQAREALSIREANLGRRQTRRSQLSQQRLAKYQEKLARRRRHVQLVALEASVRSALVETLSEKVGTLPSDAWLSDFETIEVLAGLMDLGERLRRLAFELLRRRDGSDPTDLRDHPRNRSFLERLRRRGIDTRAWLDENYRVTVKNDDGGEFTLELETDPLEIFRMGRPFFTCLRPGGACYGSVIVNAADVNKRVLYARTPEGTIVARSLLALTNAGRLLTFRPYCNAPGLDFTRQVTEITEEIARRMNTSFAFRGEVEALLADDWWDDDPRDLTGRFQFLESGSEFRSRLAEIETKDFLPELSRKFSPLPLDEETLPLVIELSELRERPSLVLPLLPLIETRKAGLPERELLQTAELALAAGALDASRRIALHLASRLGRRDSGPSLWKILVEASEFSVALRLIRKEGWTRGDDWEGVPSDWLYWAGRANEGLRRDKVALDLYRKALARGTLSRSKKELHGRISALSRRVS